MDKTATLLAYLLFLFTFLTTSLSKDLCNQNDKNTLLKIKKSLNNPYHLASWDPQTDCCSWYCLECGDATVNHRVTALTIFSGQISGQIPPEVGDLPYLETLVFRKLTNLTGTIQPTIAKLKNLRTLRLSWTNLTGPIPDFISQLKNLQFLELSFNDLSGSIPSSLSFAFELINTLIQFRYIRILINCSNLFPITMAEENKNVPEQEVPKVATDESSSAATEVTDRGLFDFMGKKKEETKPEETTIESEFEHKVQVSEPAPEVKHEEVEEKKPTLLEKLHRSDSSSSSSSEEEGEDGVKRKKRKDKKKTTTEGEVKTEEEKKGFMGKLKEKLPGHKKPEDASAVAAAPVVAPPVEEAHPAEKKGILEKIKEKLPGYHPKTTAEEEKKEKESG